MRERERKSLQVHGSEEQERVCACMEERLSGATVSLLCGKDLENFHSIPVHFRRAAADGDQWHTKRAGTDLRCEAADAKMFPY